MMVMTRVAKCHRFDGYIRVKIFVDWGKFLRRTRNLAKSSTILEDLQFTHFSWSKILFQAFAPGKRIDIWQNSDDGIDYDDGGVV